MKVTTSAGPVSSSRLTVAPVAGSGSVNGGAGVPRASMVDSVAMSARVVNNTSGRAYRLDLGRNDHGIRLGELEQPQVTGLSRLVSYRLSNSSAAWSASS